MNSKGVKTTTDSESDAESDQFDMDSSDFDVSDNEPADDNHRIRIHVKGDVDQVDDVKEANNNNIEEFSTKTILKIAGDTISDSTTDIAFCEAININVPPTTLRVPRTTIVQISGATQEETNTDPTPVAEPVNDGIDGEDLADDENAVIVDFLGKANELVGAHRKAEILLHRNMLYVCRRLRVL